MPEDHAAAQGSGLDDQPALSIGEFRLDLHLKSLNRGAEKVRITPRPLSALEYLVKNRHRVVSKDELLEKVWGGQREVSAVEHVIGQLRRALGDTVGGPRYIETVPGQGYRFVAEVRAAASTAAARTAPAVKTGVPPGRAVDPGPATGTGSGVQGRIPLVRYLHLGWIIFGVAAAGSAGFGALTLVRHVYQPVIRSAVVNGRILTALGASGDVLWRNELDLAWKERTPGQDAWRTQVADLNGNGIPEVLVAAPTAPDEDQLFCFSPRGKLLWRFQAQIQGRFGTWDVNGPWIFRQMLIAPDKDSRSIYLALNHPIWWPSFIVQISRSGASRLAFANSGNTRALGTFHTASGNYILAAGTNNEYKHASLAILRQNGPPATSPQADAAKYFCTRGCPSERPYRYILFPRSELGMASDVPYNFAVEIHNRTNGLTVVTEELKVESAPEAFYEFSKELQPESVAYGDGYREVHKRFEREGRIKHSFDECPERKAPAILRICDEHGHWSEVSVPRVP